MAELTAPLVLKDEQQRIVYGPVLVPDQPDSDGDVVKADQIEKVAHRFVEQYGNIDLQHSLNNVGRLVESYILPMDLEVDDGNVVPKGSWVLGARVTDADSWDAVQAGTLTGFSIMAVGDQQAGKAAAQKRITLADLADGWIVNAVSLVDQPAVPMAKWTAIKAATTGERDLPDEHAATPVAGGQRLVQAEDMLGADHVKAKGAFERLADALGFGSSQKAGRVVSDATLTKLRAAHKALGDVVALGDQERAGKSADSEDDEGMDKDQVQELIDSTVQPLASRMDDVVSRLERLAPAEDPEPAGEQQAAGAGEQPGSGEQAAGDSTGDSGTVRDTASTDDETGATTPDQDQQAAQEPQAAAAASEGDGIDGEALAKSLETLASQKRPLSNRITGQDGQASSKGTTRPARDAFGYKIKGD